MRMFLNCLLFLCLFTLLGCGTEAPNPKDLEDLQQKAQKEADTEERDFQAQQKKAK